MSKNLALIVSGCIFGLVAIVHLFRIFHHVSIMVAGHAISTNVSYIGFVVALILAVWMFKASR